MVMDRELEIQEFDCKKQTHGSVILKNELFLIMKKANHSLKISNLVFLKEYEWQIKKKTNPFFICVQMPLRGPY